MKKRLFWVALTALIPSTGMLIYNEAWYRNQRDIEIHDQALQASRQVSSEVERIVEGVKSLLIATSAIPAVTGTEPRVCDAVLGGIARELPSIAAISMLSPDGVVTCSSLPSRKGTVLADRSYFRKALTADGFVVGGFVVGRMSDAYVLPVAKPVRREGKLIGVLVAGLKISWFQERIRERGIMPGGIISIADAEGMIIVRWPELPGVVGTRIAPEYRHLLTAKAPGTLEAQTRDGVPRIIGYQPVSSESPLYVATGFSKAEVFGPVNRGTQAAALLIIFGGIVAAAAAVYVGNRFIVLPINHVVSVIQDWSHGNLAARTGMQGRYGEIGQVAAAVDELLDELGRRRERAEEAEAARALLSRELSHRVKNTLSVVQAIARQTFSKIVPPDAIDSYSFRVRALAGAYDTLLAEEWESADIRDVVTQALAPHHQPGDGLFRLSGGEIRLVPKAVIALSLVLHELATNAVKYGALSSPGGHVELGWRREGTRIVIAWGEVGGPPVTPPAREGFGTKVVTRAFGPDLSPTVAFDYRPEGLQFLLTFDAAQGVAA
jgi:two-component sensor histidine kinase